jgi:ABC-type sugar transport system ATPase subunit
MEKQGVGLEGAGKESRGVAGDGVLLELRNITKRFPGITALSEVSLEIRKGEVHAIVGENGAGKSTLCNIITGIHRPTKGEIYWKGKPIRVAHPSEALHMGIAMVYQERNLIPSLTGAQNICLGRERSRWGFIDEEYSRKTARELRDRIGAHVPLDVLVSDLGPSHRQMIEIIRALGYDPELLILDEPTASLDREDVQHLFQVVERIKKEGRAVIFISHKLEEVFAISDRICVFRDGQKVQECPAEEMDTRTCIRHMINRDMTEAYPPVHGNAGEILLEAKGVSDGVVLKDVTLNIRRGEVVGFYGLVGAGRTEFAEVVFGLRPKRRGELVLDGQGLDEEEEPVQRIGRGVYLIPEDRRRKGLFEFFNVRENTSIAFLKELAGFFGVINGGEERRRVQNMLDSGVLRVAYKDIEQEVGELSGGNKQKVVIGRWLTGAKGLKLMIMDEPTQGIDVGAKREIYNMMREFAEKQGIGVMFISSELPELMGVCDRMYVFKEGTVSAELSRGEFDQEKILGYALP